MAAFLLGGILMATIRKIKLKKGCSYRAEVSFSSLGRRRRLSKTFRDIEAAKEWVRKTEYEKNQGVNYQTSEYLFWSWFWLWFKTYKQNEVAAMTAQNYKHTRDLIKKLLPTVKVSELTRPLLQSTFNAMDYSKETKRKKLGQVKAALNDAVIDGVIPKNPALRIRITADSSKTKNEDDKYLSDADFEKVRQYLVSKQYTFNDSKDMALLVCAYTGARIGEVLDLRFGDIDVNAGTINIDSSWDRVNGISKAQKTPSGIRKIKVPEVLITKLKLWGIIVKKEQLKVGNQGIDDHLFIDKSHYVLNETTTNSRFKVIQRRLGLTKIISQHGLRHNVASRLLANHLSIEYVSQYLGHANSEITRKFYVHLLPEQKAVEDVRLLELLG